MRGYALAEILRERWKKPVRLLNDADMQGYAVISRKGLELVVTLGSGVGTAVFRDGELMPRLELSQHPVYRARYCPWSPAGQFGCSGRQS
jgi:polyphosphate glucokinase